MKTYKYLIAALLLWFLTIPIDVQASGSGDIKAGYILIDDKGNESVNRGTFNEYEGGALSLQNFRYDFKTGLLLRADLNNVSLNNRNLNADLSKPGLFSLKASHDKFRRIYNFGGSSFARREKESASLSLFPIRYLEIFGGGSYMNRTGSTTDLFSQTEIPLPTKVDYKQTFYNGGIRLNYLGSMVQGEFRGNQFRDNLDAAQDQNRTEGKAFGQFRIPRYKWVVVGGGFRHFESKFKKTDFMISSNRGWGSATVQLPQNISVKYLASIDRTSSDSDYTATDNVVHAGYASWERPQQFGFTIGYQYDINDDYQNKVRSNNGYFSWWAKPSSHFEWRGEAGNRKEEVQEGSRLLGDEDINRYRMSLKYRDIKYGSVGLRWDGKIRKNDQIGSKTDINRTALDGTLIIEKYGSLSASYSFGVGTYKNRTQEFAYADHLIVGDLYSREYRNGTVGFGFTYYRSKRYLDVESFNLRFSVGYRFLKDYRFEGIYNVHNFDDFTVRDQYYTANIVELSLIRGFEL